MVNQYFSNEQLMMLQNYPFKLQDITTDINITEYKKLIDKVSDFML